MKNLRGSDRRDIWGLIMPTVQLRATLTSDTTPLSGKTITFYYRPAGGTYTQLGSPKTTGTNGVALSDTITLSSGYYDFKAEFAGDDTYEASSAEVTNYLVGKLPTSITLEVIVT